MNGQAGKGSSPRPFSVDQKTYADNWERAFGSKEPLTCYNCGELMTVEGARCSKPLGYRYGDYCGAPLTQLDTEGVSPTLALPSCCACQKYIAAKGSDRCQRCQNSGKSCRQTE